ncbi:hypothetical protein HX787_27475 [Pseudomonas tolaasii]|uniref:Uncharacterized protein n=1 Tax=Pseudomonas tolaasii TaxID=29442 RepID=A0A7Y8DUR9_PSETO|nr:hypothetical protein [Pseudomonas tolaasii]NWC24102.1 hypothetical protein [Pseudomonas tolaasii]NWD39604.1 hypothetical protein [Pseudomonas tolaasii]
MGRVLAIVGIVVTVVYLVFVWWLVGERIQSLQTMALNEVGDFLAGVFGPLAILWLVLGFFQQGVELRQGTEALKMQAKELRASVQQQSAMVDVSKEQLRTAIDAAKYERQLNERSCEPHTGFKFKYMVTKGPENIATFVLINTGPRCRALSVIFSASDSEQIILIYKEVFASEEIEIEVPERLLSISELRKAILSYTKNNGTVSHEFYGLRKVQPRFGQPFAEAVRLSS